MQTPRRESLCSNKQTNQTIKQIDQSKKTPITTTQLLGKQDPYVVAKLMAFDDPSEPGFWGSDSDDDWDEYDEDEDEDGYGGSDEDKEDENDMNSDDNAMSDSDEEAEKVGVGGTKQSP